MQTATLNFAREVDLMTQNLKDKVEQL